MSLPALPKVSFSNTPKALGLTINNDSYAATLAQMRGYCKEAACDFYAQLNPYKSYTLGDIGAWSTSTGTIEVPRTAFRIYGRHTGWLGCTVAHEIAPIQRNHISLASYYASNTIRSAPEKKKEELNNAKPRQQELEADRDSALMMARAGYKGRICIDDLVFLHNSSGDGCATEPDSNHLGYDERIKELAAFYAKLEKEPPAKSSATPGHFTYSPADNLLSFVPSKP